MVRKFVKVVYTFLVVLFQINDPYLEQMDVVLRKDVEDVKVEGKLLKESVERVSASRSVVLDGLNEQVGRVRGMEDDGVLNSNHNTSSS